MRNFPMKMEDLNKGLRVRNYRLDILMYICLNLKTAYFSPFPPFQQCEVLEVDKLGSSY